VGEGNNFYIQGEVIKMSKEDTTIKHLLDLDGERFCIDESLGLWVKLEAKQVTPTIDRPHGIKYSLTLHDKSNIRIMGFDNAHAIEFGKKKNVAPKKKYDHWHRSSSDEGKPYNYENAGKLMEDFWKEVDKMHSILVEDKK
jgi:hypothetical protein